MRVYGGVSECQRNMSPCQMQMIFIFIAMNMVDYLLKIATWNDI